MRVTVNSQNSKHIKKNICNCDRIKMMKVTHKKQNKETGSRKSQKMRFELKQTPALRQKTNQEGQYEEKKKDKSEDPSTKSRWREPTGRRLKTLGAVDAGGEQRRAVRLGVALGDRAEAPTALRRVGR